MSESTSTSLDILYSATTKREGNPPYGTNTRNKKHSINTITVLTKYKGCFDFQIIQQILKLVQERLEGCSDAVCKTTYLRLIGNTGLPGTLDLLLKYAENGEDATISGAAIKAMRRLDRNLMSEKVRRISLCGLFT